ncbi:N-acetyltransferase [Rhodoferax fermentans]|uniref:GNAT family N-acetyltransferase n=2 Tax=Rhodoferax fermentans TaxID=28066 RepID=A0A1T1AYY5_RHOFE|nr:N-acetyltransferase [Rhodoferax fermentans]OOV09195.1 GNAT family N-acetyltransferase [Rhodoferax fermentans]
MLQAYAQHPQAFSSSVAERAALPVSWWVRRLEPADDAPEVVLGVFDAQALVAVVGVGFEARDKLRHKATLFGMYVAPQARQRGLGSALVQAALDCARARPGIQLVQLTVTEGNQAAQALYERFGFVSFGLEPMAVAVADGFVSKHHMWRPLAE